MKKILSFCLILICVVCFISCDKNSVPSALVGEWVSQQKNSYRSLKLMSGYKFIYEYEVYNESGRYYVNYNWVGDWSVDGKEITCVGVKTCVNEGHPEQSYVRNESDTFNYYEDYIVLSGTSDRMVKK